MMSNKKKLTEPPADLTNCALGSNLYQQSQMGITTANIDSATPKSLTFVEGKPFIMPNSNLARVVMMTNGTSNEHAITITRNINLSSTNSTSHQKPVSNLTALLSQHNEISGRDVMDEAPNDIDTANNLQHISEPYNIAETLRTDRSDYPLSVNLPISDMTTISFPPTTMEKKPCPINEADSASGPPPTSKVLGSSAPSQFSRVVARDGGSSIVPRFLPPISLHVIPRKSKLIDGEPPNETSTQFSSRVRRCMSSKELGTLAPPSGSPYATMIYQKEALEISMRQKLATMRKSAPETENQWQSDESSSSSRARGERTNEMRNRRRAQHAQAVVEDLCKVVADLFIAESKLLNPSNYGVMRTTQRVQIVKSIHDFVTSFPLRYALGADTPSEVLLHMRLMAAVRHDRCKAVVHIHNLSDDCNWSLTVAAACDKASRSLRLVTISCNDADGLLEYVTRLLSSGGSRVLDADVMLSTDGIVLDRFIVEMNGRLRLDKLSNSIEAFLKSSNGSKIVESETKCNEVSSASEISKAIDENSTHLMSPNKRESEPTGPLYYKADTTPDSRGNDKIQLQEIESAVPLTEMLASSMSQMEIHAPTFPELRKNQHPSMHEIPTLRLSMRTSNPLFSSSVVEMETADLESNQQPTTSVDLSKQRREKRTLVDRPATSNLDHIVQDYNPDEAILDYVTVHPTHSGPNQNIEQRIVPLIPFDELMLIETIGTGRVSTIYRAAWQKNHIPVPSPVQMVALKVAMVNPVTNDSSNVDELRREADIAARLVHPNVVDLVGVAADPECFCLAYEYCEGGSLLSLLSDHRRYYEYLPIALDIANGMAYLHSRNVIHRDLKPSNILLTRDHRAKIADFGMSVANFGQELTAETGTYRYMAPEVIRHESYSSNADVYSFGLCLWQIITREVPFANLTPIQAAYAVAEGRRPVIPADTPLRLKEIISACWHQDSHRRPSFTYITMALADYAKMAFSPANVGALTLQIANETLANVEGNSTINVDFSTPVGPFLVPGSSQISFGLSRHDSVHSNVGLEIE